jgi:mannose-6-phosphate isomerase
MGTHKSGPSRVKTTGQSLKDYVKEDLPFLFKVLSVRKALSIQAHPDRRLAARLHVLNPTHYRDDNHKPEMAIALTEFEALCGFRTGKEILEFAREFEAFYALIRGAGDEPASLDTPAGLKDAFSRLMRQSPEAISRAVHAMPKDSLSHQSQLALFHRLNAQFPEDVGVFCVFFLHHVKLEPGQAIFLAANEPHAYLSGSCIECMATSDNVVRAGLTPKFRDVETLCEMLSYRSFSSISQLLLTPEKAEGRPKAFVYRSPVPEFGALKIELGSRESDSGNLPARSILLCVHGSGTVKYSNAEPVSLKAGSIFYVPAHCGYTLTNDAEEPLLLYQAYEAK